MNPTVYKIYTLVSIFALALVMAWRSGYHSGQDDSQKQVASVLREQSFRPHLGGTWDAMSRAFPDLKF